MVAMEDDSEDAKVTSRVINIPYTVTADELLHYLESMLGEDSVYAVEILSEHKNWMSRGIGRVQFSTPKRKREAANLSRLNSLVFKSNSLMLSDAHDDIIHRPAKALRRVEDGVLHAGLMKGSRRFCSLEKWEGLRGWLMPEKKRLEFWLSVGFGRESYKLEIRFEDVTEAVGFRQEGHSRFNAVLIKLKYGPRIYQKHSGLGIAAKLRSDRYHVCKEDHDYMWIRTIDFSPKKSIGLSTCFCWKISEELPCSEIFSCLPFYSESESMTVEDGDGFHCESELTPLINIKPHAKIPHEILFQLNSLVHFQKISLADVDDDLIQSIGNLSIDVASSIMQRFHQSKTMCCDPLKVVHEMISCCTGGSPWENSENRKTMNCHRVIITPTKIYCMGPEVETSNYVVKNFAAYASEFIRVTFSDENWSKVSSDTLVATIHQGMFAKSHQTRVYHRILSILRDGLVIGSKRYEFLAFSASQLRSRSLWMFASNEEIKAEDIRSWMGCFKSIRSVSKCAARMGQLFSSSLQTIEVRERDVEHIPDIEIETDGVHYCFSDGVGKISLSFAQQVAMKCGLKHIPSVFQIRYGGYKGVIAVDRNSYRKLSLRKSMLKFESENRMLNVTNWSKPMPSFLNREIITLLTTLGVEDDVFEELLDTQLDLLSKMMSDRKASIAVLENLTSCDDILVKMLNLGYHPDSEPYLSMMLSSCYQTLLTDLRSKCKVFVPKGRVLIGCMDEVGNLEYGQVFVRLTLKNSDMEDGKQSNFQMVDKETGVLKGKVVVTRNPCLHPGDIRVLEAVYDPVLDEKNLVDCVVFPQKGPRPHPNECSGGDLDGDQFFLSWDERLIPRETDTPMDYFGGRPRIMDHEVTIEEIQNFFVKYIISDSLGSISSAHLVHADREPEKARSANCLQLAALHSVAVDFAKSGAPAEMPRFLIPRKYPDFMERVDKPTYVSGGILGKLYRATLSARRENSNLKLLEKCAYDGEMEVAGMEEYLEVAKEHRNMYSERMRALMNYFGAEEEDEILSGNLRNREVYLQRDNRVIADMKDRILEGMKQLKRDAAEWFDRGHKPGYEDRLRLASAWYHVVYNPSYCNKSGHCLSFPWVVADLLLLIKTTNRRNHTL